MIIWVNINLHRNSHLFKGIILFSTKHIGICKIMLTMYSIKKHHLILNDFEYCYIDFYLASNNN